MTASTYRVLVFGGSQGAHAINVAMVEAAPELAARGPHLRLTHQTGERDVEMVRAAYQQARAGGRRRAVPLRHGTATRTGGRGRLPRRRDDAGGDHGGGQGGDSDSAADGDRRSPAQERRGAGGGRRGGRAAAARPDRSRAGGADSGARRRHGATRADGGGGAGAWRGPTRRG